MPSTDTRTTELAHTRYKVHWQVNDSPGETLASGLNPVHHAAVLYAQLPRDVLDDEKLPGGHFSQDHLDVWRGDAVVVFEARVAERFLLPSGEYARQRSIWAAISWSYGHAFKLALRGSWPRRTRRQLSR